MQGLFKLYADLAEPPKEFFEEGGPVLTQEMLDRWKRASEPDSRSLRCAAVAAKAFGARKRSIGTRPTRKTLTGCVKWPAFCRPLLKQCECARNSKTNPWPMQSLTSSRRAGGALLKPGSCWAHGCDAGARKLEIYNEDGLGVLKELSLTAANGRLYTETDIRLRVDSVYGWNYGQWVSHPTYDIRLLPDGDLSTSTASAQKQTSALKARLPCLRQPHEGRSSFVSTSGWH